MKNLFAITLLFLAGACALQKQAPGVQSFDDLTYPFPTHKLQLAEDLELAYFDEGKGNEVILFIHGLGSYAPAWKKNIESLSKDYRCLAIDLPGYGKSSKGRYEASMSYYATVVKEFLHALGIEKATLAGHSMGGQIAITAALAYPGLVERLILVAPAGFETFHKGERQWFREVLTPTAVKLTTVEQIRENIAWNFYEMPADAEFMVTDRIAMRSAKEFDAYCYIIPECVKGMVDQPVFDELPKVQQPTLAIYGRQDNLIPNRFLHGGDTEDIGQQGVAQMPNARLLMVDKAGHFVQFEQAARVNEAIRGFMGAN
ncbi:MAG: alpha/beta hydrolase [Lewinellaceae bacterium]|nr:alpha/beta hydrolase [Phaeodactylibacter sp.]MCB9037410.1 alpha/beta hydrolase [Lewinellaceae bacterium]